MVRYKKKMLECELRHTLQSEENPNFDKLCQLLRESKILNCFRFQAKTLDQMHSNDVYSVYLEQGLSAFYKPALGQKPLCNFDYDLHKRERAVFLVSEALGLHVVPPTIIREGPLGKGSLQLAIEYVKAGIEWAGKDREKILFLTILVRNIDLKHGHVLFDGKNAFVVDNALSFKDGAETAKKYPHLPFSLEYFGSVPQELLKTTNHLLDKQWFWSELIHLLPPKDFAFFASRVEALSLITPKDNLSKLPKVLC